MEGIRPVVPGSPRKKCVSVRQPFPWRRLSPFSRSFSERLPKPSHSATSVIACLAHADQQERGCSRVAEAAQVAVASAAALKSQVRWFEWLLMTIGDIGVLPRPILSIAWHVRAATVATLSASMRGRFGWVATNTARAKLAVHAPVARNGERVRYNGNGHGSQRVDLSGKMRAFVMRMAGKNAVNYVRVIIPLNACCTGKYSDAATIRHARRQKRITSPSHRSFGRNA
jgi:hypothetical protein